MFYDVTGRDPGPAFMSMSTDGGVTPLSAFVQARSDSFHIAMAFVRAADASAAMTFRPLVTDLVVNLSNPWGRATPFGTCCFGSSSLFDDRVALASSHSALHGCCLLRLAQMWTTCIRSPR